MSTATEQLVIDTPGIYDGIPDETYHADPVPGGSLSSTGARLLTPPSTPAHYRWRLDHPKETKTFEYGKAAHAAVLGTGPELVRIDADEWRTNAIKAEVAEVRERGAVPLKPAAYDAVMGMVEALRAHPDAVELLQGPDGASEQSAFWRDPVTGVWCRARFDRLPPRPEPGRRLVLADYKTAADASDEAFAKAAAKYGYHQQEDFYRRPLDTLGYAPDGAVFLFVVQEKTEPYLVNVVQLDDDARGIAYGLNQRALGLFRDCQRSGVWPGYSSVIKPIALPTYHQIKAEEYLNDDQ